MDKFLCPQHQTPLYDHTNIYEAFYALSTSHTVSNIYRQH